MHARRRAGALGGSIIAVLFLLLPAATVSGADRIVLRNLDILSDRTIKSFDEAGVMLDDGTLLTWDLIEQASVGGDRQEAFDRQLARLGTPLFRIRQRLTVGDYAGLLEQAEALFPIYRGRQGESAYMVHQSLMWAYLAHHRREAAVAPYLYCYGWLARRGQDPATAPLPGPRRLQLDAKTAFTPELLPVWFDPKAAAAALDSVRTAIRSLPSAQPEGIRIYFATLASAAGEGELARTVLADLAPTDPTVQQMLLAARVQLEVEAGQPDVAFGRLQSTWPGLAEPLQPVGLYWLGRGRLVQLANESTQNQLRETAVLDLLRIPAVHGQAAPEIAAAALYHAMQTLSQAGDAEGTSAVRRELLENYSQTWFAERLRQELSPEKDS